MDPSTVVPWLRRALPFAAESHVGVGLQTFPHGASLISSPYLHAHAFAAAEHLEHKEHPADQKDRATAPSYSIINNIAPPLPYDQRLVPSSCHGPLKTPCCSTPCITSLPTTHMQVEDGTSSSYAAPLSSSASPADPPPPSPSHITSHAGCLQQITCTSYIDPLLSLDHCFSTVVQPFHGVIQSQLQAPSLVSVVPSSSAICAPGLDMLAEAPSPARIEPNILPYTLIASQQYKRAAHSSNHAGITPLSATTSADQQLPLVESTSLPFFYNSSPTAAPSKVYNHSRSPNSSPPLPPTAAAAQASIRLRYTQPRSLYSPAGHYNRRCNSSPAAYYCKRDSGLPSLDHTPDKKLSYTEPTSPLEAQCRRPSGIGQLNHAAAPNAPSFNLVFPPLQKPYKSPRSPTSCSQVTFPTNTFTVASNYDSCIYDHHDSNLIRDSDCMVCFKDPSKATLHADHVTTSTSMAICELNSHTRCELDHPSSSGSTKLYSYGGEEGNVASEAYTLSSTPSLSPSLSPIASPTNLDMSSLPTMEWVNNYTSSINPTASPSPYESQPNNANPNPNPNPQRNKISVHPQGVAARRRRHKISHKFKILQTMIPGGSKMDTASMLDEAIEYIKYLRHQIWLHQLWEVSQLINPSSTLSDKCEPNCFESPLVSRLQTSPSSHFLSPSCNNSGLGVNTFSSSPPPNLLWSAFNT